MNKNELISGIADISGVKKSDVEKVLDSFVEVVIKTLQSGNEVRLIGFGSFKVSHRPESEGRNLRTKEKIKIPARTVAKFKPGKQLKDALIGGSK